MGYLPERKTVSQFDLKGRFARQYLSFAGKSSKDFLLYLSGPGVYDSPAVDDRDALRWCIAKPDKRKSRKMSCRLFSELLYKEMDWSGDCRYKILGYRIEFEGEALYVFDLVAAEVFHECKKKQSADQQPTTVAEENTEEQPVNPRKGYYPDDIAGTFGMPVEQHRQESELRQMDGFVSVGMLTGMPGQQQNL